jgi:hypothetical protein
MWSGQVSDKPVLWVRCQHGEIEEHWSDELPVGHSYCSGGHEASPAELVAAVKQLQEAQVVTTQIMSVDGHERRVIPIDFREPGPYLIVPVSASEEPT